jgi:hypothetical protein
VVVVDHVPTRQLSVITVYIGTQWPRSKTTGDKLELRLGVQRCGNGIDGAAHCEEVGWASAGKRGRSSDVRHSTNQDRYQVTNHRPFPSFPSFVVVDSD